MTTTHDTLDLTRQGPHRSPWTWDLTVQGTLLLPQPWHWSSHLLGHGILLYRDPLLSPLDMGLRCTGPCLMRATSDGQAFKPVPTCLLEDPLSHWC